MHVSGYASQMYAMFMFVTCLWPRKLTKADRRNRRQQQSNGKKVLRNSKTKSAKREHSLSLGIKVFDSMWQQGRGNLPLKRRSTKALAYKKKKNGY